MLLPEFLVTSGRNQRLFRNVATRWAVKEPPEGFEAEPEGSWSTRWCQWIFDFILEAARITPRPIAQIVWAQKLGFSIALQLKELSDGCPRLD